MNNTVKNNPVFIFLCLIFIHVFFNLSYIYLVGSKFSYMGFGFNPDVVKLIVATVITTFVSLYISLIKQDYLKLISILLFIFVASPNITIFSYMRENWLVLIWSVLCIPVTNFLTNFLPIFRLPVLPEKYKSKFLFFSIFSLFSLVFISHGFNVKWQVFLLQDIYEVRMEARQANSTLSVYAYFILAKVICPIAVIYALEKKKYIFFYVSLAVLTYLFMTTGHKSVYFTIFVLLAFSVGENTYRSKIRILLLGTIAMFIFCRLLSIFDFYTPESLFVRRLYFIPALLNLYFFDYFKDIHLYYSGSFMGWLLDYPLDRVPAREIGYVYFGSEDMSANNGYISDGYANLGSVGILFTILVTSWIYKFFWKYNVPAKYFGLIFVTFYAFQGSGLSTALITHGSLLLSILIPLFLRVKNSE